MKNAWLILMAAELFSSSACAETNGFLRSARPPERHDPPPLIVAVRTRATNEVVDLLAKGANINCAVLPFFNDTPLWVACRSNDFSMAELLIEHGANVNALTGTGDSPLHAAIENGNLALVKLLLSKGANVNLNGGRTFRTPLYVAVQKQDKAIVAVLIENGADVMLKTNKRRTPLDLAVMLKQEDIADLIRKAPTYRDASPNETVHKPDENINIEVK